MEQRHADHPDHDLIWERNDKPYICSGCKVQDFKDRFSCEQGCQFYLHEECMNPTSLPLHPVYNKDCTFEFNDHLENKSYCDACGEDILGFVYKCTKTDRCLHPSCYKLPENIPYEGLNYYLCKKLSSKCRMCNMKELREDFTGWSYRLRRKHHVHVSCMKKKLYNIARGNYLSKSGGAVQGTVSNYPQLDFSANSNISGGRILLGIAENIFGFIAAVGRKPKQANHGR